MLHAVAAHVDGGFIEAVFLVLLPAIHFNHALAGDALAQHLRHLPGILLAFTRKLAQTFAHLTHAPGQHRNHHQRDNRELPIQIQQEAQ